MEGMTELLKRNPLFSGLDEAGLDKVKGIATQHSYKKGSILFSQGDGAHGFYLVAEGKIKIYRLSPHGQEYVMRLVGPGETIAEAAVFSGKTYPASAEALEDSRLYYLNKSDFTALIRKSPQLALNMMTGLSLLLRELAQQVEDLSLKEVSARLARFLIEEAEKISSLPTNGIKSSPGHEKKSSGQPPGDHWGNLVPHPDKNETERNNPHRQGCHNHPEF